MPRERGDDGLLVHAQVLYEEGPGVRLLFDHLGDGGEGAVAGGGLDADEDGGVAALGGLEGGGELEAVAGHDAVVVVAGDDEGGGVGGAGADVVQGGVGADRAELFGVVGAAVV